MSDILFGTKFICNAFLKKVSDGRCIMTTKDHRGRIDGGWFQGLPDEKFPDCNFEGDSILKTYYKIQNKKFSGIYVGEKDVVLTGLLVADTDYQNYTGEEYCHVYKQAENTVRCAIIYFAKNQKRFVPMNELEGKQ